MLGLFLEPHYVQQLTYSRDSSGSLLWVALEISLGFGTGSGYAPGL